MKLRLPDPSSPIAPHIIAFVRHKRALNRRYDVEEKVLRMFDGYLNSAGVRTLVEISPAILDAFFLSRPRTRPRSFNHLVGVVGRLFEWMVEHDIIDRSPITMKLRRRGQARPPCILDLPAAQRLVDLAAQFPDRNTAPLRGPAYSTIFSLLFGIGLRVGEVARLRWRDVDRGRNVLTVRETKFSKSRLIPMGPSLAARLCAFMDRRSERMPRVSPDTPVFSFIGGRPVNPGTISLVFHSLVPQLNIAIPAGGTPPHVHDLRHSFAVGRLLRWYRDGSNPADNLMKLSTFMGHVDPISTAVYLTITTALMEAASQRFEQFAAPISKCGPVMTTVGSLVYQFFELHLKAEKGLSQASIRSYRDGIRLFLLFMAKATGHPISKLPLSDLTANNVRAFLTYLEAERGNHIRSRNHRLAMLHTFFGFVGGQAPELLHEAERVAAIPRKRTQPPATRYLERDEVDELFTKLPLDGRLATRDKALLLFLYNTGARAAEVVGLTVGQLVLAPPPRVNLHGKGDKWRTCPLWPETARMMDELLQSRRQTVTPSSPVFLSGVGRPLTRFGLYKLVRRHTGHIPAGENQRAVSPHVFRHTTAVHLLESGVDVNVIRGWLGHVSLDTTNRYAEINIRMKQEALEACQIPSTSSAGPPRRPVWQSEPKLLEWLAAL